MQMTKRSQPRALQCLVGIEPIAEHADGEPHVIVAVSPHQMREGVEIAGQYLGDETLV
jgi:hypothetical protein